MKDRIKQSRIAQSYTQEELARHMNVHVRTVQSWEYGTRVPGLMHTVLLAKLLEVSLDYLVEGKQ